MDIMLQRSVFRAYQMRTRIAMVEVHRWEWLELRARARLQGTQIHDFEKIEHQARLQVLAAFSKSEHSHRRVVEVLFLMVHIRMEEEHERVLLEGRTQQALERLHVEKAETLGRLQVCDGSFSLACPLGVGRKGGEVVRRWCIST